MTETRTRGVGQYELCDVLASGGFARVHLGRLRGPAGFSRTVAIKRLHPHLATCAETCAMLVDEARLAGRVRHPNVVPVLDVVAGDGELLLVMEYVHGLPLSLLLHLSQLSPASRHEPIPTSVVSAIMCNVLYGLHAAHESQHESGEPLELVHRDVSPQNVLVGIDGVARVVDFGIAKATRRMQTTDRGLLKGKLGYMAPEQLRYEPVTRRTDVYAAGVVLWELCTGKRLFAAKNAEAAIERVLVGRVKPPSAHRPALSPAIDDLVLRALDSKPETRFPTAYEMATALEAAAAPALAREVADWVRTLGGDAMDARTRTLARVERAEEVSPYAPTAVAALDGETRTVLVTRTERATGARRGSRWVFGLVALGMLAALTVVRHRAGATPATVTETVTETVTAAVEPALPLGPAFGVAAPGEPPQPRLVTTPAPSPAASRLPTKHLAPHTTRVAESHASVTPPMRPGCSLRTIDANGITRYHPECAAKN
jgi:eukaryotic-like serine/threonine-protein kinase